MPPEGRPQPPPIVVTTACVVGVVLGAVVALHRPWSRFSAGLWGPDQPWLHRDFLGGWWLFWASATPGDWLARQNHPDGALAIQHHIPNPFDAWLLGPLLDGAPFPLWWNALQMGHHLGNVAAATWVLRVVGCSGPAAAAAGLLVAASPVMLHEVAGGRTLSGAVWPGLLALGLLLRGRGVLAGLLIGVQGLCYLYTGLLFGLAALILRPAWGLLAAAVPVTPYLVWLSPLFDGLHHRPPPAGFTVLKLPGLLGLPSVPERFRLNPALWVGLGALGWRAPGAVRWALVVALALFVAVGPYPGAKADAAVVASPLAWLMAMVPGLGRMHHPVRAGLLLVPALAVMVGLLVDRLPARRRVWGLLVAALAAAFMVGPMGTAASTAQPGAPPGADAAVWLREHGEAVVDLTGAGDAALGLQPYHQLPMLEGLRRPSPGPGDRLAPGNLRVRADGWLAGASQPGLAADLARAGFSHVLVVERRGEVDVTALEVDLGPPVFPGVYSLR